MWLCVRSRGTGDGLEFGCKCFDVHFREDILAEYGKLGHYSEGNVLYVLLKTFADTVQIRVVQVMSIALWLDIEKLGRRQMQNMYVLYPPKHIHGIFVPQRRLRS